MSESLWGMVIGGLIAIISGATGPVIQHYLTKSTREEDRDREEKRELAAAVSELEDWLDRMRKHYLFNDEHPSVQSPEATIQALIYTSFPNVVPQLLNLNVAIAAYKKWVIERAKERLEGNMDISTYTEVYEPLSLALSNLVSAALGGNLLTAEDLAKTRKAGDAP